MARPMARAWLPRFFPWAFSGVTLTSGKKAVAPLPVAKAAPPSGGTARLSCGGALLFAGADAVLLAVSPGAGMAGRPGKVGRPEMFGTAVSAMAEDGGVGAAGSGTGGGRSASGTADGLLVFADASWVGGTGVDGAAEAVFFALGRWQRRERG